MLVHGVRRHSPGSRAAVRLEDALRSDGAGGSGRVPPVPESSRPESRSGPALP